MSQTLKAYGKCIFLLLVYTGGALAQSATESDRARQAALQMARRHEIPEATLPCTPAEAKWWEDLRAAGKAVQETRGGKKEKEKFLRLLQQGQERSYQPPIPDSRVIVLSRAEPRYSEEARRRMIKGTIAMVVELRPDGFVGEVEIVQGLDHGLDENAAEAARRTIFLPPVKDRKFVSFHMPMTMSFNIY
jgi:TonB family protein